MKPVVEFGRFVGVGKHPYSGEINATLAGITGHPKLGSENIVYTSRIERIGYADDGDIIEVETRNTIYRRRA
jgi:hypothetical protein